MNLIRLIKLKKINGDLDNLSSIEIDFISSFYNTKEYHDVFYSLISKTPVNYIFIVDNKDKCIYKLYEDGDFLCSPTIVRKLMLKYKLSEQKIKINILNILRKKLHIKHVNNIGLLL